MFFLRRSTAAAVASACRRSAAVFCSAGRACRHSTPRASAFSIPRPPARRWPSPASPWWCSCCCMRPADAAAEEHPQALRRPGQQRAGRAAAHAHGAGRGADRAHARGLHVPVQLPADEPLHRPLVLAQHIANCARTRRAWCWNWRNTSPAMRAARPSPIAASGARGPRFGQRSQNVLSSHRITLDGGFVVVYDKDRQASCQLSDAPPESSAGQPDSVAGRGRAGDSAIALHGPLSNQSCCPRRSAAMSRCSKSAGQEYALGMAATASGKVVVAALPMPQGLSQTTARIRSGAAAYWQLFRSRNRIRTTFFLHAAADHRVCVLFQRVAGHVPLQADHAPG